MNDGMGNHSNINAAREENNEKAGDASDIPDHF